MTCKCICKCKEEASGDANRTPELCLSCNLCDALGSSKHGLPYVPPVWTPLEPEVVVTKEQADGAIDTAMEGMI